MEIQITCANKPSGDLQNPHEAISDYGWLDPSGNSDVSLRQVMVDWAKKAGNRAFVKDSYGNKVYCEVRKNSNGTEFLQTFADGKWTDNLLSLPSCRI